MDRVRYRDIFGGDARPLKFDQEFGTTVVFFRGKDWNRYTWHFLDSSGTSQTLLP